MSNEIVTFKGKLKWAVVPPNPARKPYEIDPTRPENCNYSIEVECSDAQFKDLVKKGIPRLTTLREGDDGLTYIRIKCAKVHGDYIFADPKVVDINGNDLGKKIANGSEGLVSAELAPIKGRKGCALRLRTVMVTNLIEYTEISDIDLLKQQANPYAAEEAHSQDLDDANGDW